MQFCVQAAPESIALSEIKAGDLGRKEGHEFRQLGLLTTAALWKKLPVFHT